MDSIEIRQRIIRAGRRAVEELIKVAEEGIIVHDDPESDIALTDLRMQQPQRSSLYSMRLRFCLELSRRSRR
jgi:hypothetical protein